MAARAQTIEIRGTVFAEEGGPIAGARVSLLPLPSAFERGVGIVAGELIPPTLQETKTGADGGFRLVAPGPGMFTVRVDAAGRVPVRHRLMPLVRDALLDAAKLRPAEELPVEIRQADGRPVEGVWLIVSAADSEFWRGGDRRRAGWWPARRIARTDAAGLARLVRASGEIVELRAAAPGFPQPEVAESAGDPVSLTLEPGVERVVEVRSPRGVPLAGVLVRAGAFQFPSGLTGDDGRIAVAVRPGAELPLTLVGADGGLAEQRLPAEPAEDGEPFVLTLEPPDLIVGRVVDSDRREPIDGAFVWGTDPAEHVRSDRSGAFQIAVGTVRQGLTWVQAAAPGHLETFARTRPADPVTLALDPAGEIRGTVVESGGEPVADARVSATMLPTHGIRSYRAEEPEVSSGPDGRFRLAPLHPGATYEIEASREGMAPARQRISDLTPPGGGELVLVLEPGRRLTGRTVDPAGAPLPGTIVRLRRSLESGPELYAYLRLRQEESDAREQISGEEGRFVIDDLEAGRFDLETEAPGRSPTVMPGVEIGEADREIDLGDVVLQPGAMVEGRVTDRAGRPIEGAELRAAANDPMVTMRRQLRLRDQPPAADAVTGPDGRFAIDDRRPGEVIDLMASHPEFASKVIQGVEAPTDRPLAIELETPASIAGRVVDTSGSGIPEASVGVMNTGLGRTTRFDISRGRRGWAVTDEEGRFEIEPVDPGTVQLHARAQGWQPSDLANLEIAAGERLRGVEIVLRRGASVTGRVTDTDGSPVSGVQVVVRSGSTTVTGGGPTDGDGRYRVEGVETGWQTLMVYSPELPPVSREVEIREGENRVDLSVGEGFDVAGRVVDSSGGPVADAQVYLTDTSSSWASRESRAGPDGRFAFSRVAEGSYRLGAVAEGFADGSLEETVHVEGGPVLGLVVELGLGQAVVGRILGVEPEELASVQVWARSEGGHMARGQVRFDGTYRVSNLQPGPVSVTGRHETRGSQATAQATLPAGVPETSVDLDFASGVALTGSVLRNARPLPGASVYVQGTDVAGFGSGVTNGEGRFRIEGLAPGRYRLHVGGTRGGVLHERDLELLADEEVQIAISGAAVSGRVLDASTSEPLAGAVISAEALDTEPASPFAFFRGGANSDSRGSFRIAEIAAGTYRLRAAKPGYAQGELTVTVEAGLDLDDVEFLLSPTAGLVLRVFHADGRPAREVDVVLADSSGRARIGERYTAVEEGRVRIGTAPPGLWELLIAAAETATVSTRVTVPDDEVPIVLPPQARLEIEIPELAKVPSLVTATLTAADGRPFRGLLWGGRLTDRWVGGHGRVQIDRLPAGEFTVRVEAGDGRRWEGGVRLAGGGRHTLVLQ